MAHSELAGRREEAYVRCESPSLFMEGGSPQSGLSALGYSSISPTCWPVLLTILFSAGFMTTEGPRTNSHCDPGIFPLFRLFFFFLRGYILIKLCYLFEVLLST